MSGRCGSVVYCIANVFEVDKHHRDKRGIGWVARLRRSVRRNAREIMQQLYVQIMCDSLDN